ncbi:MAG: cytochrome c biogenesis protein CcsA [Luteibaculum sp.]
MDYIGEHLLPGYLGRISIILSFVLGLYAFTMALLAQKNGSEKFLKTARAAYLGQVLGIVVASAALFYLIFNGYFEYDYVWKHSNKSMDMKYILACFWEGYEGSFLLWLLWQGLFGLFLFKRAGKFEAVALAVFAMGQVLLISMLLGVYLGEWRVGSDPFVLMRNLPEYAGLPWTFLPDYLEKIPQFQDGRGLNPLLQNYWMTIHPPIIFMGFAGCLIPFAYAFSGIINKDYRGWIKPAMPLSLFALGILGVGILMGGAWAYEALSFGGFWAWDPVENASLVPWLLLVGAIHLMLINRRKNVHLYSLFLFSMGAYALVVYSTFLTKSGVLGDSSVHSFTDNGMSGQLMVYLSIALATPVYGMLIDRARKLLFALFLLTTLILLALVPESGAVIVFFLVGLVMFLLLARQNPLFKSEKEDKLLSREFWMFAGALVLFLSAMQISFSTSTPVYNLLLKPFAGIFMGLYESTGWEFLQSLATSKFAPPSEPIAHYNKWQVPFAILLTLLIALTQFLKYKNTAFKTWVKDLLWPAVIALAFTVLLSWIYEFKWQETALILLLFGACFAVLSNLFYLIKRLKWNWSEAGSSLSHIGFGMIILGALISTGKSIEISENTSGIDLAALGKEFKNNEDILLFKGDTLAMNRYFIRYKEKQKEDLNIYYEVEYFTPVENFYHKGDLVLNQGLVFRCLEDHNPSNFLEDRERFWEYINKPTPAQWNEAKTWNAKKAGDKQFSLYPKIQLNPTFGNVAEPSTKHKLHEDIYTHVRWAELEQPTEDTDGYLPATEHEMAKGDTVYTSQNMVILEKLRVISDYEKYRLAKNDLAIAADLNITSNQDSVYKAEPLFILRDSSLVVPDIAEVPELGLRIVFSKVNPESGKINLSIAEHKDNRKEFIVMRAVVFPAINLLWLGCIIMAIGIFSSVYSYASKKSRKKFDRAQE